MKTRAITTSSVCIVSLLTLGLGSAASGASGTPADKATIQRGASLVGIGGCADCHTPFRMGASGPEKDVARGLSGHPAMLHLSKPPKLDNDWNWAGSATMTAFVGPWGITYAANLTPDRETGIGGWTERDFLNTMRTGKHLGVARPIMPPMPWQALSHLTEDDLRAMFRYLQTIPPVHNRVPDYQPPAQ